MSEGNDEEVEHLTAGEHSSKTDQPCSVCNSAIHGMIARGGLEENAELPAQPTRAWLCKPPAATVAIMAWGFSRGIKD